MIAKLRRKFVAITMASATIVLAIILASVNTINYFGTVGRVDDLADMLGANQGTFPPYDRPVADEHTPPAKPGAFSYGAFTPETPYDTRYFTVLLASDGEVLEVDLAHIAAVEESSAVGYADDLFESGAQRGFAGVYRYLAVREASGTRYIFIDCAHEISTLVSFASTSLAVGVACVVCMFFVSVALSPLAVRPIARAHEKQRRFVTDASHELKTPLTVIGANTEILELEHGENEWTSSTKRQLARMDDLVQKMLFLARMDEGAEQLDHVEFPLSDAVREAAVPFETVAAARGVGFELRIADGVSYRGDRAALEQLVSILVDNALKYCGDDGRVRVSLRQTDRKRVIEVWNTARGIEIGPHNAFLERFYRHDTSRSSQTGGAGIGLSIARSIVESHGGRIDIRSSDGASLTCTVTL